MWQGSDVRDFGPVASDRWGSYTFTSPGEVLHLRSPRTPGEVASPGLLASKRVCGAFQGLPASRRAAAHPRGVNPGRCACAPAPAPTSATTAGAISRWLASMLLTPPISLCRRVSPTGRSPPRGVAPRRAGLAGGLSAGRPRRRAAGDERVTECHSGYRRRDDAPCARRRPDRRWGGRGGTHDRSPSVPDHVSTVMRMKDPTVSVALPTGSATFG